VDSGSVLTLPPGFSLRSAAVKVIAGTLNIQGNVSIGNQGTLTLYETGKSLGQSNTGHYLFYGLYIMSGGTLVFNTTSGTDNSKTVQITATVLDLRNGGWMTADYAGFRGSTKLSSTAYGMY